MNLFKRLPLLLLTIAWAGISCTSSPENITPIREAAIIPQPGSVMEATGTFTLNRHTKLVVANEEPGTTGVVDYFMEYFSAATGINFPVAASPGSNTIVFELIADMGAEEYFLEIDEDQIRIFASQPAGLFYGIQTLRQLLPAEIEKGNSSSREWLLPMGKIRDKPEYPYRGMMLDVARHFFPVDDVKHVIDLLAKYKMNRLHLHLSDDQGWRIEIKSWPLLTTIGGSTEVGGGEGGFYTQEDYKEIVNYAESRFITIVPEIDMPGHTNSALASYGELNPGITVPEEGAVHVDREALGLSEPDPNATPLYTGIEVGFSTLDTDKDITYQFIDDVIREIAAITPGEYFHIGGDESHVTALEDYIPFIERAQETVAKYGKKSLGWDEIAHATLLPTTVAQYWAEAENAIMAIEQGAQVLISPAVKAYLDMQYDSTTHLGLHWAAYIELDDAYNWEPTELEEGIQKEDIFGVEAPLWTETITTRDEIEFMIFPRLPAIAEIAWTPNNLRSWDSFSSRIKEHGKRWEAMGVNYYQSPTVEW